MHPGLRPEPASPFRSLGLALLLVLVFSLGWSAGQRRGQTQSLVASTTPLSSSASPQTVDMQLFWDAWNLLGGRYVDTHLLDPQQMVYGAVHGMVEALGDPYTSFMTPKENKEFQDTLEGTLEGIGAELTLKNGLLTVISPLKGSPAKKAGLQPEDVILKINGVSTEDTTLENAVIKIRGQRGTRVKLTVLHEGDESPVELSIVRETINIASVDWKMQDGIAVISINQFGNGTTKEFSQTINEVLNRKPRGVVLDLRYNGGGYLDGAVDIVSEFLDKGKVVTVKRRNPEDDEVIYVSGRARLTLLPMAVLINKGSASASEIVAGALQDAKRAVIVGEQSFGKGTVQEVESLAGGSSLRLTVAKWYTPLERNIGDQGITPDVAVERTTEDYQANRDPQLKAALEAVKKQEK